jgi:hypothetical protein
VQFSNGVSVNTHKEFALQMVPYEYIRELLGFEKEAPKQVYVHGGTSEGFWSVIAGGAHQQRNSIQTPSSKYVTLLCK